MAEFIEGNVYDSAGRPVSGATVYIYDPTGELAALTDDADEAIGNPLTTGDDGYWSAYSTVEGFYTIRYFWAGRERLIESGRIVGRTPIEEVQGFRDEAEAFRSEAEAFRDETEGFSNAAEAAAATAATDAAAIAAAETELMLAPTVAMFGGISGTYATKALMDAAVGSIAANAFVQVLRDETNLGRQVIYQKQTGVLVAVYIHAPAGVSSYAPSATDASIRAAASLALANGGGEVILPGGIITIASPLPVGSGLIYRGVGSTGVNYASGGDSDEGTILEGDGTFNCFEWNPTDEVSLPASSTAMFADSPVGFALFNLRGRGFKNFVKFGAYRHVGVRKVLMDNVAADNCEEWGFWLENCQGMILGCINSWQNRLGQYWQCSSMGSIWFFDNSTIENINTAFNNNDAVWGLDDAANALGIVITCRGVNSRLNDVRIGRVQCNGPSEGTVPRLTQASAAIYSAVNPTRLAITADIGRYGLRNAILIGTTGSGFRAQCPYFIVNRFDNGDDTGWIEVSEKMDGTPVAATDAATSTTITVGGAPLMLMGGLGDTGTSGGGDVPAVRNFVVHKTDLENGGVATLVMQNLAGTKVGLDLIGLGSNTYGLAAIGLASDVEIHSTGTISNVYSWGNHSYSGTNPLNWATGVPSGEPYVPWKGMRKNVDGTSPVGIHLGNKLVNGFDNQGDIYGANNLVNFGRPIKRKAQIHTSGSFVLALGDAVTFNGGSNTNISLPAVNSTNVGQQILLSNPTAFRVRLFTSSSQPINGRTLSASGFEVRARNSVILTAIYDGTTFGWGAVTAPELIWDSVSYNPGSVAAGARVSSTRSITGLALGDKVEIIAPIDLQGLRPFAYCESSGVCCYGYENPLYDLIYSQSFNPGSIASGAQELATFTVPGAVVGSRVDVRTNVDRQGLSIGGGYVSAADTVKVPYCNLTGGAVDLGAHTIELSLTRAAVNLAAHTVTFLVTKATV